MLEAVGEAYWHVYFEKLRSCLRPGGTAVLQVITIGEHHFEDYRRRPDFIQRYIFPGSCIPSVTAMSQSLTRATDMRLIHLEDIGPHYALTLRRWREAFNAHLAEVREQGYPENFIRMWEFYLCYCEAEIGRAHV